jgi:hypothetical protein
MTRWKRNNRKKNEEQGEEEGNVGNKLLGIAEVEISATAVVIVQVRI